MSRLKWKNEETLKKRIEKFFATEEKPTLGGLANYLGITRYTLAAWAKDDEIGQLMKWARAEIEAIYEKRLVYSRNVTGVIFALKNMGWTDRTDFTSDSQKVEGIVVHIPKSKTTDEE
jgi:hypothetical protein